MPPALLAKPELHGGLDWYLAAFWDLSADRPLGASGIGAIPFVAIDTWARRHGVEGDQFVRLKEVIRAADREYIAVVMKV